MRYLSNLEERGLLAKPRVPEGQPFYSADPRQRQVMDMRGNQISRAMEKHEGAVVSICNDNKSNS
jgi:hypothetical protein